MKKKTTEAPKTSEVTSRHDNVCLVRVCFRNNKTNKHQNHLMGIDSFLDKTVVLFGMNDTFSSFFGLHLFFFLLFRPSCPNIINQIICYSELVVRAFDICWHYRMFATSNVENYLCHN